MRKNSSGVGKIAYRMTEKKLGLLKKMMMKKHNSNKSEKNFKLKEVVNRLIGHKLFLVELNDFGNWIFMKGVLSTPENDGSWNGVDENSHTIKSSIKIINYLLEMDDLEIDKTVTVESIKLLRKYGYGL